MTLPAPLQLLPRAMLPRTRFYADVPPVLLLGLCTAAAPLPVYYHHTPCLIHGFCLLTTYWFCYFYYACCTPACGSRSFYCAHRTTHTVPAATPVLRQTYLVHQFFFFTAWFAAHGFLCSACNTAPFAVTHCLYLHLQSLVLVLLRLRSKIMLVSFGLGSLRFLLFVPACRLTTWVCVNTITPHLPGSTELHHTAPAPACCAPGSVTFYHTHCRSFILRWFLPAYHRRTN